MTTPIEQAIEKLELMRLRAGSHAKISNCETTMMEWINSDAEFILTALRSLPPALEKK